MKKEIGKRIQTIRENMNMTKEGLGRILGISGQYLGMIEHGKSSLSIEKLKILCDLTNFLADYILFGKETNIVDHTKTMLSELTDEQLQIGCKTLKNLCLFIKSIDSQNTTYL